MFQLKPFRATCRYVPPREDQPLSSRRHVMGFIEHVGMLYPSLHVNQVCHHVSPTCNPARAYVDHRYFPSWQGE